MASERLSLENKTSTRPFIIAWVIAMVFYFLEYAVRSAPAVMMTELSGSFATSALGVSSIVGMYYYTYSTTSLVAGMALDRVGAKYSIAAGIAILGIGCLLFAMPLAFMGNLGRLMQGAGSAFAFTGCVYLASHGFSAKVLATAIGVTQCLGMLGGSAGQFVVGPMIQNGISIRTFWIGIGLICLIVCVAQFIVTPPESKVADNAKAGNLLEPYKIVFSNVQSYLCGFVSGLLFAPTTIFVMTWGVAFFQQDRQFTYYQATLTSSMVPLGWVFGCPLLGWFSDKINLRKPAVIGGASLMLLCLAQLIFLPALMASYITMFIFGLGSGAAMIPYSVIKEANPDNVKGSATGAINFLTFGVTALLGPVFAKMFGRTLAGASDHNEHFRSSGNFWLITTVLAIVISLFLKETGSAARAPKIVEMKT